MKQKTYYGEYSLNHWIELLLKQNLELPPYQRNFVWTEEQVKEFINGLKNDSFVPPVTIGVCNINGIKHNLILDGQQRLSSILLAFFKVYPKKDAFKRNADELDMADGTVEKDIAEEDTDEPDEEYINWSLRMFTEKGPVKRDIENTLDNRYKTAKYDVDDAFFEDKYIPFSFIIPYSDSEAEQHEFYSSVFRNINILGTQLNPIESRKSLYFLKSEIQSFFEPDCCKNLKIELVGKNQAYDFVRTIAILSQYKKEGKTNCLAQSYKSKMEKYYEEYIYAVVNDKEDGMFKKFSEIFPKNDFKPRITQLNHALEKLQYHQLKFNSIIDADVYMFGLVYYTVIEGKKINLTQKDPLMEELENQINTFKQNSGHKSSPSLLKHMRNRVEQSIKIFAKYVEQPAL